MNNTLIDLLNADYKISVSSAQAKEFIRSVQIYENIPTHAEALGTPLLGTSKMHFLPKDMQKLFEIFGVDYSEFRRTVVAADGVDPTHKVVSDPYNMLTIWLVHRADKSSSLSTSERINFKQALLKILHYKFFTSVVNHNLAYGADEGTMQYTINDLSNKSAIKVKGSWKKVIQDRVEDVLSKSSIHKDILNSFTPDKLVVYIISDIQTRIRKQLVNIIQEYFKNKERGNTVMSIDMVEDINGDKMVRVLESSMDVMIAGVSSSSTNLSEFLDYEYIEIATKLTNDVNDDTFIRLLTKFSAMADHQRKKGDGDQTKGSKRQPIYVGYNILLGTILQKTYRLCMLDKDVDMGSKVSILKKTRNIYKSSRTVDSDILSIKESVALFITKYSDSRRPATNSSLRLAFLLYIILISFKQIK